VVADDDAAEDAAQEAMIRAWRQRRACRSPHAPEPWLRSIARNEALRELERNARVAERTNGENGEPEVPSEGHEEGVLRRLVVDNAVSQLAEDDRLLVRLRYSLDLPDVEIAAKLGIAETTVRVRLFRVRKRLRELIKDHR
jgi:RNA polymerase sigma-70 factor (ECF subfamily)